MSVLQAAGSSLMLNNHGQRAAFGRSSPVATLGVRSLREEYTKPVHKHSILSHLQLIEETYQRNASVLYNEPFGSLERTELRRFRHLFQGEELLPPNVFVAALELTASETLNGRQMPYDTDVLILRDNLVMAYKPLVAKIRQLKAKEIEELPQRLVHNFCRSWSAWEAAWLRNREVHAVDALQPLAKAILALEPLLLSVEKERLLPWPRVQHQKAVTLKCLHGFVDALSALAACVLPSLQRELDHDPRLLLLMEHVLSLRGDRSVQSCLDGLSSAPEVVFPDHHATSGLMPGPPSSQSSGSAKGVTLDAYAFKLLGASVGDAVAAGKLHADSGNGQAGRAKMVCSLGAHSGSLSSLQAAPHAEGMEESQLSHRAVGHAVELLSAFEGVKDVLLSLKSSLDEIDPALDSDPDFVRYFQRLEHAFRRAKRLFLEPDNLA